MSQYRGSVRAGPLGLPRGATWLREAELEADLCTPWVEKEEQVRESFPSPRENPLRESAVNFNQISTTGGHSGQVVRRFSSSSVSPFSGNCDEIKMLTHVPQDAQCGCGVIFITTHMVYVKKQTLWTLTNINTQGMFRKTQKRGNNGNMP